MAVRRSALVISAFVLALFGLSQLFAPTAPHATHRALLIIAGQSNALGFLSKATDPVTRIDYFAAPYTNGADALSSIAWHQNGVVPAVTAAPVPLDTPQMTARGPGGYQFFGPEIGLARTAYTDTGRPVTIVKAAFSGSVLAPDLLWPYWGPGGGLFSEMVTLVRSTIAFDALHHQIDRVGGFYWFQGETDATDPAWAAAYQGNLKAFIARVRADVPGVYPIVLAKEWTGVPGDAQVRAADDWAAAHLPDVVTVDTEGLPRLGLHVTNVGELQLGEDMAHASGL